MKLNTSIMGSCCSNETKQGEDEVALCQFPPAEVHGSSPSYSGADPPSSFDSDFFQRLTRGIEAMVIPAARTGIMCAIRFDAKGKRFILRKNELTRPVNLSSVQRVMHTPKDLRRIEGQAGLAEDENCCALLLKTQSCISLRFNSVKDNQHFIDITKDLLAYYNRN